MISAALCYYTAENDREPGEGRLPRYTWFDAYAELRERLDVSGEGLEASTACSSMKTTTSTARLPRAPASASSGRTRC